MKLTVLSVRRPVATVMFFIGVILLGVVSLRNLTVDLLPSLSYPKLTVITEYPGAAAEEVEQLVTTPLEAMLSPISGVRKVKSISREGLSIVTLEFHWGTNMDFALLHVKEKVEEARESLPSDCGKPQIYEWDPSSRPIIITVLESKGRNLKELREAAEFLIKPRLEQLEGISRVEVRGGGKQEILVKLYPEKLSLYGITFEEVGRAIQGYNQVVLGGTVKKDKLRHVVKVEGEIKDPRDIALIPVKKFSARQILVRDIAEVGFSEKIRQSAIRYNSKPAIALLIFKEADANTVKATENAKKAFAEIEKEFKDFKFGIISEEARLILSSINSLKLSLYLGAVLAFFVLLLFLQNARDPLLVAVVMPIAVISTFVLMYFAKVNINIMSLGGLALGVGMFVDNSIVVLESLFRHRAAKSADKAAIDGALEVAAPITASTFTTIVIFLPVIYIYGITGRLFRDQALTVSFSLLASLFVALTLLPSLFSVTAGRERRLVEDEIEEETKGPKAIRWFHEFFKFPFRVIGEAINIVLVLVKGAVYIVYSTAARLFKLAFTPVFKGFNALYSAFFKIYHRFLEICLDRKIIAFSIAAFMLAATAGLYMALKKELLPQPRSAIFEISSRTPPEMGFEETDQIARVIEDKVERIKGVRYLFTQSGAVSTLSAAREEVSVNNIHMIVGCEDARNRDKIMDRVRSILASFGNISYSVAPERSTLSEYLRFGAQEFQIQVFYERLEAGRKAVTKLLSLLSDIKGLVDLRSNLEEGKPVLALNFKDELLKGSKLSRAELARLISNSLKGERVSVLRRFQRNYDIVLSTPLRDQRDFSMLLKLPVRAGEVMFRLEDIVEPRLLPSIKEITREGQERYFLISANLSGRKLSDVVSEVEKKLREFVPPSGTRVRIAGEEEERRKAFSSIKEALLLAAILVYMVMASQFENLIHPLIIMFTVPMGFFGAFLALFITGGSINVIAGIGFLVMVGIVVNDAIVKIDYTNRLRREGRSLREAVLEASRVRLRPILMTTFTTIFGLLPMALMQQPGAELQRPLAIVVIGGLLFSTFLTLILIPVIYEVVEKRR